MRTWLSRLAVVVAALAVALFVLGLRGPAAVPATLAVVAVALALLDAIRPSPFSWAPPNSRRVPDAAEDASVAALRRLIEDNASSRTPDAHLRDRLLALARQRRRPSEPLPPALVSLLSEPAPQRFDERRLTHVIEEIEKL